VNIVPLVTSQIRLVLHLVPAVLQDMLLGNMDLTTVHLVLQALLVSKGQQIVPDAIQDRILFIMGVHIVIFVILVIIAQENQILVISAQKVHTMIKEGKDILVAMDVAQDTMARQQVSLAKTSATYALLVAIAQT